MNFFWTRNKHTQHLRRRPLAAFVLMLLVVVSGSLCAARYRPSYEEDKGVVLREILDSLHNLRHEVNNHESEIRLFEEKFRTQEEIMDALRQQVADSVKIVKESVKILNAGMESKFAAQEDAAKVISTDLKAHANDSAAILADYKRRIADLEKVVEQQNHNLDHLQAALHSLAEVLQIKESPNIPQVISSSTSSSNGRIYKVKAGDSLEKLARQNNTTIKKLKEMNNLSSDQIIIGQKLHLPE